MPTLINIIVPVGTLVGCDPDDMLIGDGRAR
jgi:hypothetical protein